MVAGHLELVPEGTEAQGGLRKKGGITVLARTGAKADAAAAVAAKRKARARVLYTLNARHFLALARPGDPAIEPPG